MKPTSRLITIAGAPSFSIVEFGDISLLEDDVKRIVNLLVKSVTANQPGRVQPANLTEFQNLLHEMVVDYYASEALFRTPTVVGNLISNIAGNKVTHPITLRRIFDQEMASQFGVSLTHISKLVSNPSCPSDVILDCLRHGIDIVSESIMQNHGLPESILHFIVDAADEESTIAMTAWNYVAGNPGAPPELLRWMAEHPKVTSRSLNLIAKNPASPPELIREMSDENPELWEFLARNPSMEEEKMLSIIGVMEDPAIENDPVKDPVKDYREFIYVSLSANPSSTSRVLDSILTSVGEVFEKERWPGPSWVGVAESLALHPNLSASAFEQLFSLGEGVMNGVMNLMRNLMNNPSLPLEIMNRVVEKGDFVAIVGLAESRTTPPEILDKIVKIAADVILDPQRENTWIALSLAKNPANSRENLQYISKLVQDVILSKNHGPPSKLTDLVEILFHVYLNPSFEHPHLHDGLKYLLESQYSSEDNQKLLARNKFTPCSILRLLLESNDETLQEMIAENEHV